MKRKFSKFARKTVNSEEMRGNGIEPRMSKLKDYPFVKLEVGEEISNLRDDADMLVAGGGYEAAESVCRISRTLTIALEEEAWAIGAHSDEAKAHRAESILLLDIVLARREAVLKTLAATTRKKAEKFFNNTTERRGFLRRWIRDEVEA